MAGKRTDADVIAKFRANYLLTGNAAATARWLKEEHNIEMGRWKAWDIGRRMQADPAFIEERAKLAERYLDELVAMRQGIARDAADRYHSEELEVVSVGKGTYIVVDKRTELARIVIECERSAHHLEKFRRQMSAADDPTEVEVKIRRMSSDGDD